MNALQWGFIMLVVGTAINLLPGYIAYKRGHKNTLAVFMTAILLGWTIIGWCFAMIWAVMRQDVMRQEKKEAVAN